MKIIKESTEKYTLNEAGLSRILQHTTDDITFAVIGSQDKDTKRSRWYELRGLVQDAAQKALKINPQGADAYKAWGLACGEQGKKEEALKHLAKAKELGDPQAQALMDSLQGK